MAQLNQIVFHTLDLAFQYVDIAYEAGDKPRLRREIDVPWRPDLLDFSGTHNGNPLCHDHSFILIMRDQHECRSQLALHADQLELRLLPQFAVERGKRFVEQQKLGSARARACERDTLFLTAGQFVRFATAKRFELDQSQHFCDARLDDVFRQSRLNEPEGDVLFDVHMRKQRIGLKHHIHGPQMRRHIGHIHAADQHAPLLRRFESGDEPQQCRLAATRRAEQKRRTLPTRFQVIDLLPQ